MSVPTIDVQIDERGPAAITMRERDRHGHELELERSDPYLAACERDAYDRLLARGRRLPAGTIDVVVGEDEFRRLPGCEDVGGAIARAA